MVAPIRVASVYADTGGVDSTSLTLTLPTIGTGVGQMQVGDRLVLVAASTQTTTAFVQPSGWMEFLRQTGGTNATIAAYTRNVRAGDGGATVTMSWPNVAAVALRLFVYRGAGAVYAGAIAGAFAATATIPSVKNWAADSVLLSAHASRATSDVTWAAPQVESFENYSPAGGAAVQVRTSFAEQTLAAIGDTGTRSASTPTGFNFSAVNIVVEPGVYDPARVDLVGYQNSGYGTFTHPASHSMTPPETVEAGDLLIAVVVDYNETGNILAPTISGRGATWTLEKDSKPASGAVSVPRVMVYAGRGANAAGAVTLTTASGTIRGWWTVFHLRGVTNPALALELAVGRGTAAGTATVPQQATAPSLDAQAGQFLVALNAVTSQDVATKAAWVTPVPGDGWNYRSPQGNSIFVTGAYAYRSPAATTPTAHAHTVETTAGIPFVAVIRAGGAPVASTPLSATFAASSSTTATPAIVPPTALALTFAATSGLTSQSVVALSLTFNASTGLATTLATVSSLSVSLAASSSLTAVLTTPVAPTELSLSFAATSSSTATLFVPPPSPTRRAVTSQVATAKSVSLTIPAEVQVGDAMIILATLRPNNAAEAKNFNLPSGWTRLAPAFNAQWYPGVSIFGKVATGSDAGSTVTLALNGSADSEGIVALLAAYANAALPPAATTASAVSFPPTAPSMTVIKDGTMLVSTFAVNDWNGASVQEPSVTAVQNYTTSGGFLVAAAIGDDVIELAGETNTRRVSGSSGSAVYWHASSLLLEYSGDTPLFVTFQASSQATTQMPTPGLYLNFGSTSESSATISRTLAPLFQASGRMTVGGVGATLLAATLVASSALRATLSKLLLQDNFNRPDSTSAVGAPQIGPAPTVAAGTVGIKSNELYASAVVGSQAVVMWDLGRSDVDISMRRRGSQDAGGIVLNAKSATDFWYVSFGSGANPSRFYRLLGTTFAEIAAFPGGAVVGSLLRAAHRDGVYAFWIDGALKFRLEVSDRAVGTQHGVRFSSTFGQTFDDITAASVPTLVMPDDPGSVPDGNQTVVGTDQLTESFLYRGRDTKFDDILGVA